MPLLTKEEKNEIINRSGLSNMSNHEMVSLIEAGWWKSFTDGDPSGPIDNSSLLIPDSSKFNPKKIYKREFEIVHSSDWSRIVDDYQGGPQIQLEVVLFGTMKQLEKDPKTFRIGFKNPPEENMTEQQKKYTSAAGFTEITISRYYKENDIYKKIMAELNLLPKHAIKCWTTTEPQKSFKFSTLRELEQTLGTGSNTILLEVFPAKSADSEAVLLWKYSPKFAEEEKPMGIVAIRGAALDEHKRFMGEGEKFDDPFKELESKGSNYDPSKDIVRYHEMVGIEEKKADVPPQALEDQSHMLEEDLNYRRFENEENSASASSQSASSSSASSSSSSTYSASSSSSSRTSSKANKSNQSPKEPADPNDENNWWGNQKKEGKKNKATKGDTGLKNLGNTCYMNSALQCLSHALPLTNFFLSFRFVKDININNKLGCDGKMAAVYAAWLRAMWSGDYAVVNPGRVKSVVSHFSHQFSGYSQQDSQEFLTFLLDGLHEDLNRIKDKPYVENVEATEDDVASSLEAERRFKLRNDSAIVDLLYGQLKSTVDCPTCGKRSVSFDPLSVLSLPLPGERTTTITVFFVPRFCSQRVKETAFGELPALCEGAAKEAEQPSSSSTPSPVESVSPAADVTPPSTPPPMSAGSDTSSASSASSSSSSASVDPLWTVQEMAVEVPKYGTISHILSAVGKLTGIPAERLVAVPPCEGKMKSILLKYEEVSTLSAQRVAVYEMDAAANYFKDRHYLSTSAKQAEELKMAKKRSVAEEEMRQKKQLREEEEEKLGMSEEERAKRRKEEEEEMLVQEIAWAEEAELKREQLKESDTSNIRVSSVKVSVDSNAHFFPFSESAHGMPFAVSSRLHHDSCRDLHAKVWHWVKRLIDPTAYRKWAESEERQKIAQMEESEEVETEKNLDQYAKKDEKLVKKLEKKLGKDIRNEITNMEEQWKKEKKKRGMMNDDGYSSSYSYYLMEKEPSLCVELGVGMTPEEKKAKAERMKKLSERAMTIYVSLQCDDECSCDDEDEEEEGKDKKEKSKQLDMESIFTDEDKLWAEDAEYEQKKNDIAEFVTDEKLTKLKMEERLSVADVLMAELREAQRQKEKKGDLEALKRKKEKMEEERKEAERKKQKEEEEQKKKEEEKKKKEEERKKEEEKKKKKEEEERKRKEKEEAEMSEKRIYCEPFFGESNQFSFDDEKEKNKTNNTEYCPWFSSSTKKGKYHRCIRHMKNKEGKEGKENKGNKTSTESKAFSLASASISSESSSPLSDAEWLESLPLPPRALLPYRLAVGDFGSNSTVEEITQSNEVIWEAIPKITKEECMTLVWTAPYVVDAHKAMALDEHPSRAVLKELKKGKKEKTTTIEDCFNIFTSKEQLSEENAWYCSECKEHKQAWKKLDIWQLPSILTIQLKRFSSSAEFGVRQKLDMLVNFPVKGLNLAAFEKCPPEMTADTAESVKRNYSFAKQSNNQKSAADSKEKEGGKGKKGKSDNKEENHSNSNSSKSKEAAKEAQKKASPPIYDLFAVSNHMGGTGGGHYTAYAYSPLKKKWMKYNDDSVDEVSENSVVTKDAYILYYKRRGLPFTAEEVDNAQNEGKIREPIVRGPEWVKKQKEKNKTGSKEKETEKKKGAEETGKEKEMEGESVTRERKKADGIQKDVQTEQNSMDEIKSEGSESISKDDEDEETKQKNCCLPRGTIGSGQQHEAVKAQSGEAGATGDGGETDHSKPTAPIGLTPMETQGSSETTTSTSLSGTSSAKTTASSSESSSSSSSSLSSSSSACESSDSYVDVVMGEAISADVYSSINLQALEKVDGLKPREAESYSSSSSAWDYSADNNDDFDFSMLASMESDSYGFGSSHHFRHARFPYM
ncbi:putative ubiquitin specific peptidase 11 [Monocercomonoides exilis]|uniref:putative ubiquitin specific peptidase 11 n=1 Tax=Monocercomonoides exilis TaxID=2049356 RepID=UPI00355A42C1|nr:putative ubiquitin specific peptidase 11 [Monocercomonoides exilis]|eukprot:MONOS_1831.1-p1 / transcript=MONOS_1831.1 / gene=MONOS_1831 / organism=Monocercomonoides_exilis_PA203 / gene_product=ubiquitin specific peptidase 11 / transcript_product=ubiquitin specific peptidase 11 / location=Mono_scaffold00034:153831-159648(+) / protein_length=1852 / sequence_SO=supercontig / SO=protein_coding / is_pseudo=false